MMQASVASIFRLKKILLRAKRASPPQELSKFGAKRQFFASLYEKYKLKLKLDETVFGIDWIREGFKTNLIE